MKIRRSSVEPTHRIFSSESKLKHRTLDPKLEKIPLDPKLENRSLDPKLKDQSVTDPVTQTVISEVEPRSKVGASRYQNPTRSNRILKPSPRHGVSKPCARACIPKPTHSSLLVPTQDPVTKFPTLMKKFGETELSNQNHETLPLQDSLQNSGEPPAFNCEGIEDNVKLNIKEKQDQGFQVGIFTAIKKPDYLAPTPPGSDYEELSISAASPEFNSLSHPDILSPPLSISSGLDFPHSPFLPQQYHIALSPSSQISQSPSGNSSRSSPATVGFGRHLSSSPNSTISSSPIPDFLPTSPIPDFLPTSPIPDFLPTSPLPEDFSSSSFQPNLPTSPLPREQLSSTSPALEFHDDLYISPLTEPGQSDPVDGLKFSKCSYSDYTNALVQSFVEGKFDTFTIFEAKETDFKFSKSNEFLLSSLVTSGLVKAVSPPPEIKDEPACKVCSFALCLCAEPARDHRDQSIPDDNQENSEDNPEDRLETRIESSKLPDDIPTLASLAKSSPKVKIRCTNS